MNKPKRIYLLLVLMAGVIILAGCWGTKKTAATPGDIKVSFPRFFAPNFNKALYKAGLTVHGRELTGLMLFKKSNGIVRAAFISEIGMKYFNLEIPADDTATIRFDYLMDMLNRKPVTRFLDISFRILFMHYPANEKTYSFECNENRMITVMKYRGEKVIYGYDKISGQVTDVRQNGLFKPKIRVEADDYSGQFPAQIHIRLKNKMRMDLTLLED